MLAVDVPPKLHLPPHDQRGRPDELNLSTHRAPGSVWDRRGWKGSRNSSS